MSDPFAEKLAAQMHHTMQLAFEALRCSQSLDYKDVAQVPAVHLFGSAILLKMLNPAITSTQFASIATLSFEFVENVIAELPELQELIANFHLTLKGMMPDEDNP